MNAVNQSNQIYNTLSPDEVIRSLCNREADYAGKKFMLYKGVLPDVWRDLNLSVVRYAKRYFMEVDKKTNSVLLPESFLMLSYVAVIDSCGQYQTLIRNENIANDIVDIALAKKCGCECGCNSELCGHISSYESVVETEEVLMPDDTTKTFEKITRTRVDKNGNVFIERTFPVRKYTEGNWIDVVLTTEEEFKCKLDVKKCGCVSSTDANKKLLTCNCEAACYPVDAKELCSGPSGLTYNIEGNRISFDKNFTYDRALIRVYEIEKPGEIKIPIIAKEAMIAGLKDFTVPFDERQPEYLVRRWKKTYDDKKMDLGILIHRCTLRELYSVLNPKRNMV